MACANATNRELVAAMGWLAKGRASRATPEKLLSVHVTASQHKHYQHQQYARHTAQKCAAGPLGPLMANHPSAMRQLLADSPSAVGRAYPASAGPMAAARAM